ncbi:MAG: Smr/MutS family protein [Pseudoflavonifractor sp.]|nr:Smr/MutS family protein [Alloprevotella sp.]MCM1116564.1 Smr/MutS family protein [Pseudoflavonifractor sp.]
MIYPESSFEKKIGFDSVRREVGALCLSPMGRREADSMAFSADGALMAARLEAVAEMLAILRSDEELPISTLHDMESLASHIRVPGTFLTPQELYRLGSCLSVTAAIALFFNRRSDDDSGQSPFPRLVEIARGLVALPAITSLIDRILDRHAEVRDTASPALAGIRSSLRNMAGTVNAVMRRVMARASQEGIIDADAAPTMRDGRLVIPVAPMNKRRLQGIVHDESASGKTIFIEPAEVVEVNNHIRELQMEEQREIARILIAAADEIRPHIDDIIATSGVFGLIDFIHAKARYAAETGGTLPNLNTAGPEMEWYHACHPVLLASLRRQGKEIVPTDITLTSEKRLLIISGPNAGGKSVTLKTVGIIQYMSQCGMLPPVYENSHIGVFADIFIDIGDDQSIEDDLSTYSSHLRNMRQFTSRGNNASLILIDEFGAGTEPQIGGAIAQAILHRFAQSGMWGVITTHFQNLKKYADDTPGLVNGSMLYDRQKMEPLFKLSIGNAGSSFALEIARKTGLDPAIIEEAESIVGSDYVKLDRYLLDIARDRRYWDNKRQSIRLKEKRLEQMLELYENDAEALRHSRREILDEARAEARRIIDSSNAGVERAIKEIREAQAERERTLAARARLREERNLLAGNDSSPEPALLAKAPKPKRKGLNNLAGRQHAPGADAPLAVGAAVKLDGSGQAGRITDIQGKNATVIFGNLKTSVPLARLKPTASDPDKATAKAASFVSRATSDDMRRRQLEFKPDIDVRGMRTDEAVQAVTYFIDDAIQFSARRVRILHGTGTGALRQYIRAYLATVPGVAHAADEDVRLGGAGITVVDLA